MPKNSYLNFNCCQFIKNVLLTKNLIKVCSIPEIVDILENWDIKVTDEFLNKMSKEKEIRDNEVRKKKELETKK